MLCKERVESFASGGIDIFCLDFFPLTLTGRCENHNHNICDATIENSE